YRFRHAVELDARSPAAQSPERLVGDDARQPGREARFALEAVEMGEGADIALLNHLLGLALVIQNAAREAVEPPVVEAHQRRKRRRLAAPEARQKVAIACRGIRLGCRECHRAPRIHLLRLIARSPWRRRTGTSRFW